MKIPLTWLKDYIALTLPVAELVERLTLAGLEVSSTRFFGLPAPEGFRVRPEDLGPVWDRDKVVVAKVLEVTRHPNADKLKLVSLDYGTGTPKVVVTGAPNISVGDAGQMVILALTGSKLFDGHVTPKVISELKPTQLRGVPSDAMVCSAFELGTSEEHDGIILLESEAPVGVPLADFMGEVVIEVDVLPNMARCLAMVGIAREVSAIAGLETCIAAKQPTFSLKSGRDKVTVAIADPKLCPRYSATILEGVKAGMAPGWMRRRLEYAGMRSISATVDITNYVMLEFGQPLHAFDYDALVKRAGGKAPAVSVRPARDGETIVTLDKAERTLSADDLVIADAVGAIAIAGVMGGLETEVGDGTTTILLESACFDAVSVRKTARKFNLFSEASTRYSKGIHPELVAVGAMRAAELMQTHAGAEVLADPVDVYPAPLPTQVIELTRTEILRLLGVEVPAARVESILKGLQFGATATAAGWSVTVPTFRLDIQSGAADLIEELARIEGYDRLPGRLLSGVLPEQRDNRPLALEEKARDLLADLGLQEVMTYSFSSAAKEAALGIEGKYVEIVNPISVERNVLRRWLLPNMLEVVRRNLDATKAVRIFEIGTVFHPARGARLPDEFPRLGIVLTGRRGGEAWDDAPGIEPAGVDFFDFKGIVETFLAGLHVPAVTYRLAKDFPFLHPGKSAEVLVDGRPVGMFGAMHPLRQRDLKFAEPLLIGEFDLEAILEAVPVRFGYTPISTYPSALRDMAVVVAEGVTHDEVLAEITAGGGEMLGGARLFDVYRGESIPAGTKSMAFALSYRSKTGTLAEKEIDTLHKKIEGRLKHMLKAGIRGK